MRCAAAREGCQLPGSGIFQAVRLAALDRGQVRPDRIPPPRPATQLLVESLPFLPFPDLGATPRPSPQPVGVSVPRAHLAVALP